MASVGRNEPCPCGSGRKFKNCHGHPGGQAAHAASATAERFRDAQQKLSQADYAGAVSRYNEILALNPEHADARHYLGMALCFRGNMQEGLAHLRASLNLRPDDPVYCNNLALWQEEAGDFNSAEQYWLHALAVKPDYRDARLSLAKLMLRRRRHAAARMLLEAFVRSHPDDIEYGQLYAEALSRLGEMDRAKQVYRDLLASAPDLPDVRLSYAGIKLSTGLTDDARREAEGVLERHPGHVEALQFLASLEERCHCLDRAEERARAALASAPESLMARVLLARIQRRHGNFDRALAILREKEADGAPLVEQSRYHMEHGTILDKLGQYAAAFEAFRRGNEAFLRSHEEQTGTVFYEPSQVREEFAALKRYFTRSRIEQFSPLIPAPVDPAPLFIVGFPRSGTTLVEQMLTAHPNLHAGDELVGLYQIESSIAARLGSIVPYPDCLDALSQPAHRHALEQWRDHYLQLAREAGALVPGVRRFTDKMPLNETRFGLIRLLFPQSPVVHVVRHPLDVVLSCFANELSHGKHCALRIETAAFHYAQVMDLAEHQAKELGLRYRRVRYEDLLDDPEAEVRALLEFVGEPWNPACLEFHRSARASRTASYAQVTQPLYRSSAARWRNYRDFLEPAMELLRPVIERLGYDTK